MRFLFKVSLVAVVMLVLFGCKSDTEYFLDEDNDDVEVNEANTNREKLNWNELFKNQDREEVETEVLVGSIASMEFKVYENDVEIGSIEVDTCNPERNYKLSNGISVKLAQYFPDFEMRDREPVSISKYPFNPAMLFIISKGAVEERRFVAIGYNITTEDDPIFYIKISDMESVIEEEWFIISNVIIRDKWKATKGTKPQLI